MKQFVTTFIVFMIVFFPSVVFCQDAGDFRSAASGDWSLTATWETFDGTNWLPAGSAPTGSEDITIDDSVNVDVAVNVTGDVQVEGTGRLNVGVGTLTFDNGSSYNHARNSGTLPTATWNVGSTCLISGITGNSPGNANQNFYHFTWDNPGQSSNLNLAWSGNTIGGNLTCVSSGSNRFQMTSNTAYTNPITINGDVIVAGGTLTSNGSSGAQTYTINVNGNVNVTGGNLSLSRGSGGIANWYLSGNFSVSNATIQTSNNTSKFVFAAVNDTQLVSLSSVAYTGTINYDIDSAVTIEITDGPDAVDMTINGMLMNKGHIITIGSISFGNNSTYHHARNGGSIPVATWGTGSTLYVNAVTNTMPSNRNQSFYNIVWDCPNQSGNFNMGFDEVVIGGDITINNTGSSRWYLCGPVSNDTVTVTINGNIAIVNGNFAAHGTGNSGTGVIVYVNGNVTALAGNFSVARGSQNGTGITDFYLLGENFILSNVTTQNSNPTGAKFIFAGTNPQNLVFTNVVFGGGGCPVEVATGSNLNVGTSQFYGSGLFTLNAGATLECGNQYGLDSTFSNTGTVTLNNAANYTFNGTVAQVTGVLLPSTVNDLTINNSTGVALSNQLNVSGNLNVTNGDLSLNGHNINLGSTGTLIETPGNTIIGSTGSISGYRDLNVPVGVNVAGLGTVITSDENLTGLFIERFHAPGTGMGNEGILRQYFIAFLLDKDNNSRLVSSMRFYYDESELNGILEDNLTLFHSADGSDNTWSGAGGTVNTTDNYVELTDVIDVTGFWTLADINAPIPVELTSFTASTDGRFVTLNWVTASELNNNGWEVERRIKNTENNFSPWIKTGFVEGSGNTTEIKSYVFSDKNLTSGIFQYRLKQLDFDGTFSYSSIAEAEVNGPTEFALFQNYPNPFNPATVIRFEIPASSFVTLNVYNAVGEKVATLINKQMERGVYLWNFDASNYPSGIYIYRLNADDKVFTKKMMLIK